MSKIFVKSDMNNAIRKLAAYINTLQSRAIVNFNSLTDVSTKIERKSARRRVKKYERAQVNIARLLVIANTPAVMTKVMLAEAWEAMVDVAMDMNWDLDGSERNPRLFAYTYHVIDELRSRYGVDSTDPEAYAA